MFSCEFCEISKNTFFKENLRTTALILVLNWVKHSFFLWVSLKAFSHCIILMNFIWVMLFKAAELSIKTSNYLNEEEYEESKLVVIIIYVKMSSILCSFSIILLFKEIKNCTLVTNLERVCSKIMCAGFYVIPIKDHILWNQVIPMTLSKEQTGRKNSPHI